MQTSAFFTMTVDLDNETFALTFRWNGRESAWYMDLCQEDQTVIAGGIKVVPQIDLTSRFRAIGSPLGSIVAIGESQFAERPGRDELGKRVKLYYLDQEEVSFMKEAS